MDCIQSQAFSVYGQQTHTKALLGVEFINCVTKERDTKDKSNTTAQLENIWVHEGQNSLISETAES
jgi:hypothetical protein